MAKFYEVATDDPLQIINWWAGNPDYNIGILCGNGLIVLDIDIKNGVNGLESLKTLGIPLEKLNTYIVNTPSGGFHAYYNGPEVKNSASNKKLGSGLDIRCHHGYVVAPGSVVDGRVYDVRDDRLRADAPERLLLCLEPYRQGIPGSRGQGSLQLRGTGSRSSRPLVELDQAATVQRATEWLKTAPIAIEDGTGDARTLATAMYLKDIGLSERMVGDLMLQHWNQRCSPPWDEDALRKKVRNAYLYGENPPGILHPEVQFRGVHVDPPAPVPEATWPDPQPLPLSLPPVAPFHPELVPSALRAWVMDVAERMQCPPDYVAVAAMVAAGAVLGRRIGIRPQERTDWIEVPNLWGCVVGRPGVMKTPAMMQALKPIMRLDAVAAKDNADRLNRHAAAIEQFKAERAAARVRIRKGDGPDAIGVADVEPAPPRLKRYLVNDATYEALGVVMQDNPNGVMIFRDELVSLLKPLDRDENAPARGFFLSAWNGTGGYTFDRIMRGHTHVESCCLSLLGATQPAKLSAYLRDAVRGGAGDDGFAQRLGLLVWPDVPSDWRDEDRYPDAGARRAADLVFDRLDALDPIAAGAERDAFDPLPFLRFDPAALSEFRAWRTGLEARLRSDDMPDVMASYHNKSRGLVPKLALLTHLIDGGVGPVSLAALRTALAWVAYLETHAARAYACVTSARIAGARTILAKLKAGALTDPFRARDVHQRQWSGLADHGEVGDALGLLVDHDWLSEERVVTGGRPTTVYRVNPKALGS